MIKSKYFNSATVNIEEIKDKYPICHALIKAGIAYRDALSDFFKERNEFKTSHYTAMDVANEVNALGIGIKDVESLIEGLNDPKIQNHLKNLKAKQEDMVKQFDHNIATNACKKPECMGCNPKAQA